MSSQGADPLVIKTGGGLSKPFKSLDRDIGNDIETITDGSSVGSSDESFFAAEHALTAIRRGVVGKIKQSAKGIAQKSAGRIRPVLQRVGQQSQRMLTKPTSSSSSSSSTTRTTRRDVSKRNVRVRPSRRSTATKFYRFLQRVNQDPFVTSRVALAVSAFCLLIRAGDRLLAACWATVSLAILHETTAFASTKSMGLWYFLSCITFTTSVSSWGIHWMFGKYISIGDSMLSLLNNKTWCWTRALPRLWGAFTLYLLYQDVVAIRSTKHHNEDDNVDCWTIEVSLLQARNLGYSHSTGAAMMDRKTLRNSDIVIRHGPVRVGSTDGKSLINNGSDSPILTVKPRRFETLAFSHFLERQPAIDFHLVSQLNGDVLGTTSVPVPSTSCLKVVSWHAFCDEDDRQYGELLLEVQKRPSPEQFLIRSSTFIPILSFLVTLLYLK